MDCACDLDGLVGVWRGWRAVDDVAVATRARDRAAEDHERRRTDMPAFADVRAVGFLADRVQTEAAHESLEPQIVLRPGGANLQPLGLRLTRQLVGALATSPYEIERRGRHHRSLYWPHGWTLDYVVWTRDVS